RRPVRPFALGGYRADARPSIALHADGDAIANRLAATEHVVQAPLAGVDDDRSCGSRCGIIHHFACNYAVHYAEGSLKRPHLAGLRNWRRTIRTTDAKQCTGKDYGEQANRSHDASTPRM